MLGRCSTRRSPGGWTSGCETGSWRRRAGTRSPCWSCRVAAGELASGFALPETRPLAGQIEHSFVRRVGSLPEQTQRLLLIAAAEPLGDAVLLQRAADQLGIAGD